MGVLKNRRLITAYPDPDAPYRVSIHIDKGYRYASTQPATVDPETGKRKYHRIHWGTVEDGNRFVPGNTYLFSPVEERTKLIFPDGWNLSEIEKLSGNRKPGRPVIESQDENRLYGDMLKAQHHYKLRDEQEKYFSMMKGIMGADRQRNWSESGKTGRLFIQFVAQILGCYLSNVRKEKLDDEYDSVSDVLGEMRLIRYIEHPNTTGFITPFIGGQVTICEAFGFDIPEGCAPEYVVRKTNKGKRGRPHKNALVVKEQ